MKGAATFLMLSAIAPGPRQIETLLISSRPDYRLTIERLGNSDDGPRLAIYHHGQRTVVSMKGGLITAHDAIGGALAANNRFHSKFVFSAPTMPSNIVIVFGYAFASDPGATRIIRLSATSGPQQILSEDTFHLTEVRKAADGHSLLVIGKRSLSQMSGNCITTYDPYSVFQLSDEARGRFRYSLSLSKRYNLRHYAGWAGPNGREDIGVNICKKPWRIVRMSPHT